MKRKAIVSIFCMLTILANSIFADFSAVFAEGEAEAEAEAQQTVWAYESVTYGDETGIVVTEYKGTATDIYIPSKIDGFSVLKVGDSLFKDTTGINSVTLGNGIKVIGESTFENSVDLVCIVTPQSLSAIGDKAFYGCTSFNSIILYDTVTDIGEDVFMGCEKLTIYCNENSVSHTFAVDKEINFVLLNNGASPKIVTIDGVKYYVGNGEVVVVSCDTSTTGAIVVPAEIDGFPVTEISEEAFSQCTGITSVSLPETITYISKNAFYKCSSLSTINIPSGITVLPEKLFYSSGLTRITLPYGLERIETGVFSDTNISAITLPDTVNYLGAQVFWGCSYLRTISIPEGVTELKYQLFAYCYQLNNVVLPSTLTSIADATFQSCNRLTDIYYNGSREGWANTTFKYYFRSVTIHYGVATPVESISLSVSEKQLILGDTFSLSVTFVPAYPDDETITVSSSNPEVATFNGYNITAVGVGECVITVTSNDGGFTAQCNIEVIYPCGEIGDISWNIDAEDTLYINGEGDMPDFSMGSAPWYKYRTKIKKIVLSDSITGIGEYAFYSLSANEIVVPEGVTHIGTYAFGNMNYLNNITLPNSLVLIEDYAFYNCVLLKNLNLGSKLEEISNTAFSQCAALEGVNVDDENPNFCDVDGIVYTKDVTELVYYPINKSNLEYTVPETVTKIPDLSFNARKNLEKVVITKNVTSIGGSTFMNCASIQTVVFENKPDLLPEKIFYGCTSLKNVNIPESVSTISNNAFYRCSSLEEINLPSTLTSIGQYAFYDCNNLTNVYISDLKAYLNIDFGNDYAYAAVPTYYAKNLYLNNELLTEVVIPDGVETIPQYAFYKNTNIISVTIPNSVKTIGRYAFSTCRALEKIVISENLETISEYAFFNCSALTEIVLPPNLLNLMSYCFSGCTQLSSIDIPNTAEHIGANAFYNCSALTEIYLPSSLTYVDTKFATNSGLTDIYFEGTETQWSIICSSNNAFGGINLHFEENVAVKGVAFENAELEMKIYEVKTLNYKFEPTYPSNINVSWQSSDPEVVYVSNGVIEAKKAGTAVITVTTEDGGFESSCTVTVTNDYDVYAKGQNGKTKWVIYANGYMEITGIGNITNYIIGTSSTPYWREYAKYIKSVVIGEGITNISACAFKDCINLVSVSIPDTVTEIGQSAFYGCTALEEIELPNGVKKISDYAFMHCKVLKNIKIPDSVEDIGSMVFYDCTSLKAVYVSDIKLWCEIEFPGEYSNPYIYSKNLYIGEDLLGENIVVPYGTSRIGSHAFYTTDIKSIVVPSSVKSIGNDTFFGCKNLERVILSEGLESIGHNAFKRYWTPGSEYSLKSILIPESVTDIAVDAFEDDTFLYVYENSYAQTYAIENRLLYFVIQKSENPDINYGSAISGTVRDMNGNAVSGAVVEAIYDNGVLLYSTETDENGEYTFTYAEVGAYTICASDEEGRSGSTQVSIKRMNAFDVFLAGETSITVKSSYTVSGTSSSGAKITLAEYDGRVIASTNVDEEGAFTFTNIPNGTYTIKAENDLGAYAKEITVYNADLDAGELKISDSEEFASIVGAVSIEGREQNHYKRSWVQVTLYNSEGTAIAQTKTDKDGNYEFAKLPLDEYSIVAEASELRCDPAHGYDRSYTLTGYAYVNAAEPKQYTAEEIVLTEENNNLCEISGIVYADKKPTASSVILKNVFRCEIARCRTDASGKYTFKNVRDGLYFIFAVTDNYGMGFTVVTVRRGRVFGRTDISVFKQEKIKEQERKMGEIPHCSDRNEAIKYRDEIRMRKKFYDGLSEKEKLQFSPAYVERLNRLCEWITDFDCEENGGRLSYGGMLASEDELGSEDAKIELVLTVSETQAHKISSDGIKTEADFCQQGIDDAMGAKTPVKYYDITLTKNGTKITDISKQTNSTGKLRITLEIPEEYRGHKNYSFVHMHNGIATTLVDLDDDPNTVTFEIDRFSTFALAYTDEELTDTGSDDVITYSNGKITVKAKEDATLYIAKYTGNTLTTVEDFKVKANEEQSFDFDISQTAFLWKNDMVPLCKKFNAAQ